MSVKTLNLSMLDFLSSAVGFLVRLGLEPWNNSVLHLS